MADQIERLAALAPGPELAVALSGVEAARLSAHDAVLVAKAIQRQQAHSEAVLMSVLAELASRPEYRRCSYPEDAEAPHEHRAVQAAGDEVSLALSWTPTRATMRVVTATELVHELPATLAALADGQIDADKARLIAERTRCLHSVELKRQVEAAVLPLARRKTRGVVDAALRREVMVADPEAAEQRRRESAKGRRVGRPEPAGPGGEDGMAQSLLYGYAEDLAAFWVALDAAAQHARTGGDRRTLDQLRFDLLTGLGWTALELGHLGCCNPDCTGTALGAAGGCAPAAHAGSLCPTRPAGRVGQLLGAEPGPVAGAGRGRWRLGKRRGKAAAVGVVVPFSSLAGLDDAPGWLDGYGPIGATASRRVSAAGTLRRLLVDPADGALLEYGRTTYAPPAELAAFVAARDRTCRFPTCNRAASEAEIDHRVPYNRGGTTGKANTWILHSGHHLGKTHHGFGVETDHDGVTWWITPAGHTYRVEPEAIGPAIEAHRTPPPETPSHSHGTESLEQVPF